MGTGFQFADLGRNGGLETGMVRERWEASRDQEAAVRKMASPFASVSWHMAHGTWRMAHGAWRMAHGTWHMFLCALAMPYGL